VEVRADRERNSGRTFQDAFSTRVARLRAVYGTEQVDVSGVDDRSSVATVLSMPNGVGSPAAYSTWPGSGRGAGDNRAARRRTEVGFGCATWHEPQGTNNSQRPPAQPARRTRTREPRRKMQETIRQPNAVPFPDQFISLLTTAVGPQTGGARPTDVVFHDAHSNDVAELRYQDGRTLMVKRGRYDWAGPRFLASRLASQLLNGTAGVLAPAPLEIPDDLDPQPVEAYWRVDLPTLQELWPALSETQQARALRSLGKLIDQVHSVKVSGHGPLAVADQKPSFEAFMHADLGYRLFPAVSADWHAGVPLLERLRSAIAPTAERVSADGSTLLHNDLHMGNILCENSDAGVRCVGLLDLETAFAGPPEADLAILEVHHGPLFAQPIGGDWIAHVRSGYRRTLDPVVMSFFRVYHMLNMGFYSAIIGHEEHADRVAKAALEEAVGLPGA